ncbi:MAG TPA: TetR-like C-terminal domain-containing protein, partial [Actinotalea sp.]|nr:TetR-like C-terminal domain-containing protein [Actinotalea sp.]
VFQPGAEATRADAEVSAAAVAPLLRTARDLVGEGDALAAARTVTAWASGFLSMELADAFRMGGDVDEAFAFGVETLVSALRLRGDAAVGRSPAVGAGG